MEIWLFNENHTQTYKNLESLPHTGFIWIDANHQKVLTVIKKVEELTQHGIHERHIKDCLNLQHPSFYDSVHAYDVLIFRSLTSAKFEHQTETNPIAFLIFNNILVSFHTKDPAINRIKCRIESTRKRLPEDPMSLLFLLLDEIVDNFLELRSPLLERYGYWQKKLFLHNKQPLQWLDFLNYKTEIRKLRTLSEEQQEVIYQWHQDNEIGLTEQLAIRFSDISEHIKRVIRYSMQLENDLDTLIELYYSLIGNRTNDVVRILTVLSAIFLPLNLVASIFGMNFSHMHLLEIPNGEDIILLSMVVLAVVLFIIFKWKNWI